MLSPHHSPSGMVLSESLMPSHGHARFLLNLCSSTLQKSRSSRRVSGKGCRFSSRSISNIGIRAEAAEPAVSSTKVVKTTAVKAVVTVQLTAGGLLSSLSWSAPLDAFADLIGKSLLLEVVSAELDPKTGLEKKPIKAFAGLGKKEGDKVKYEAHFKIEEGFGEVGGVIVTNEHHKEMHLIDIVFTGYGNDPINIMCNSWVHAKGDSSQKRIFFTNKSFLPSQTPSGLKRLRSEELEALRGDGEGERKSFERIYDYDTYNDLGNPDSSDDLARPVLGGKDHPYPRRCRTGRPRTKKDPLSESRSSTVYVPRDEDFSEVKELTFNAKTLGSVLKALVPSIQTVLVDSKLGFPAFTTIDSLYQEGINLPKPKEPSGIFRLQLPRLVKAVIDTGDEILSFETPDLIERDKFSWLKDEEFSRQTLAGVNPMSIELVKEFPFVSKLDPNIYGPPESAITKELVEREIKGFMTLEEAIETKKLFVLDYHDFLLPYVHKVRELEGTTLYGSRTLFFLTHQGTLRPIAIELTRPASSTKPQWKQVFTPGFDATDCWLWKLAKVHVCAHDSGYHELVIHWLRTHACVEPYIIAANRQLSVMHPIYRLLHPHFRYTMEINVLAREALINAGGIIESSFSPLKYSMEISSVAYDKFWRFDLQALPADLINRGMAVEDPTAEHGLKLTIEDYPFASDGLLIWSSIKQWVSDYVTIYYADNSMVSSDTELQEFWTEVRTKGHGDKKDEPWWPTLKTKDDLIQVLTTIIWVASAHHAAVNFGQYTFGGYFPNRPSIARNNMPVEDESGQDFEKFWTNPGLVMLECFPSQLQATIVMAVLDVLSSHSPDEEYLGDLPESAWTENPAVKAAFELLNGRLKGIEGIIDARNSDKNLRNRAGAGVVPYELLKPFSKPGVTGMGVPNSISI
ncbi:linoleate 13S-lipoxygenase 2-1, chloroplastic-like protein [Cinnamomum micranthum f. kanehirae]|uniref:Lipoxygenase n=1 Tax=Cinnamomum micranthum f. kanehirae TaxID=337451 RepID=A0A443NH26_9MAGN|nr:linoleate 13S-lipoxygenase 2-1, chloroplastic-like protein [Cinnamomum micranthum f. kanehirae]